MDELIFDGFCFWHSLLGQVNHHPFLSGEATRVMRAGLKVSEPAHLWISVVLQQPFHNKRHYHNEGGDTLEIIYNDARMMDHIIYKWSHSRAVIAKCWLRSTKKAIDLVGILLEGRYSVMFPHFSDCYEGFMSKSRK